MKRGIIIRNVADLRVKPGFRSERKSQLLFNETFRIEKKKNGYFRVVLDDGYTGWIDERAVNVIKKDRIKRYSEDLNYRIKSLTARVYGNKDGKTRFPAYLFYGTKLHITRRKGRLGYFETTLGQPLRTGLSNIVPLENDYQRIRMMIVSDCRRFLGTPYLWGGKTPFGIDCSGLVQLVYGRYGIELPRDSKDQMGQGEAITREDIRPADLYFYKGHVAVALGEDRIIHASLAEGGVAENSMNPRDPDYRKDLKKIFIEARRVLL